MNYMKKDFDYERIECMSKQITYTKTPTHYNIYVNGIFHSSCDFVELNEELEEIENND